MSFLLRLGTRLGTMLIVVSVATAALYIFIYTRNETKNDSDTGAIDKNEIRLNHIIGTIKLDNVRTIRASVNDLREHFGRAATPIPDFEIDKKYHPIVFKAIFPAKRHDYPASWDNDILGHVTVTTKTGDVLRAAFCFVGQNRLFFSVDGIRYTRSGPRKPDSIDQDGGFYRDEGMILYNIIREIHKEQTSKIKSGQLTDFVDALERALGEKPPLRSQDNGK